MVGRIGASAGLDMSPETRTFSSAIVCEGQPRDERVYWLAGVRQKDHQLYRKKRLRDKGMEREMEEVGRRS